MPKSGDPKNQKNAPSKRDVIKARLQNESRQQLIPLIIVSIAAVALVIFFVLPAVLPKQINSRPQANGTAMGDPNAPVKIEEFADFQCPACAVFTSDFEPQIVKDYIATGKVYFKFIPFSFIGAESKAAAEAAYCASDQGKFWEYHDLVLADQRGENQGWYNSARLLGYASDPRLGLNTTDFKTCFESGKYKQKVLDDMEYSKKNNVNSTPSFVVNGQITDLERLVPIIESALKAKSGK